ncbi:MAG TPA: TOBE-like domain-containing protein [Polyangium sp.]|nr:TOBE-like domain-containing protein [Polyangium sp.]
MATARVERLVRVGWMVRIELTLDDDQPLTVELTKDRVAELGLVEGEEVFVNLRDAKLFVQDSSI